MGSPSEHLPAVSARIDGFTTNGRDAPCFTPANASAFICITTGSLQAGLNSQEASPTPIRRAKRRTLNPYVRGVLRTVSALAAMIGVVFFLSGVLPSLAMHEASAPAPVPLALPVAGSLENLRQYLRKRLIPK